MKAEIGDHARRPSDVAGYAKTYRGSDYAGDFPERRAFLADRTARIHAELVAEENKTRRYLGKRPVKTLRGVHFH